MSGGASPAFEQRMQDVAAKYAHMLQPRRDTTGTPMKEFKLAEDPEPRHPTSHEQIAKVLTEHQWYDATTDHEDPATGCTGCPDWFGSEDALDDGTFAAHQTAVLAPLFAEAQAEAWEQCAESVMSSIGAYAGGVWAFEQAYKLTPNPYRLAQFQADPEGRALVAGIHERKQAKTNNG